MKVHIIGIPSAGKTTLAAGLAEALGVPHHDLDGVAYVDDRWTMRPSLERRAIVDGILAERAFVTDGGFLGWTEPLFAAADRIIWLDPPLRVLTWRHIRRHGVHPHRLPSLLAFQWRSYRRPAGAGPAHDDPRQTRAGIEAALRPWAAKVLRLVRSPSVAETVDELRARRGAREV